MRVLDEVRWQQGAGKQQDAHAAENVVLYPGTSQLAAAVVVMQPGETGCMLVRFQRKGHAENQAVSPAALHMAVDDCQQHAVMPVRKPPQRLRKALIKRMGARCGGRFYQDGGEGLTGLCIDIGKSVMVAMARLPEDKPEMKGRRLVGQQGSHLVHRAGQRQVQAGFPVVLAPGHLPHAHHVAQGHRRVGLTPAVHIALPQLERARQPAGGHGGCRRIGIRR